MTGGPDSWKTNDPVSAAVAGTLARIENDLGWVRKSLDKGEENFKELKDVAAKLTGAVERLTENARTAEALEKRVRELESTCTAWKPAIDRWQRIHDAFTITMLKWLLTGASTAAAVAWVIVKVAR